MPRRIIPLREEYFDWLYGLVGDQARSYVKLCKLLHSRKFYWSVRNDENRCEDGLNLRRRFSELVKLDESHLEVIYFLKADCTVFEMMVALAQRINDITYDLNDHEDRTSKWFYEMLQNLRMSRFTDKSSPYEELDPVQEAEVVTLLCDTLDRTYDRQGRGSFFPLKRVHKEDMRETEIWYQLMLWLDENHG